MDDSKNTVPTIERGQAYSAALNKKRTLDELHSIMNRTAQNHYLGEMLDNGGLIAVVNYLNKDQAYYLMARYATWGIFTSESALSGKLGYHAFIQLPGERRLEWTPTPTTDPVSRIPQVVERLAKGSVIEDMMETHEKLAPKYNAIGKEDNPKKEGCRYYRPYNNDCFTYVDRILVKNQQKPIEKSLKRIEDGFVAAISKTIFGGWSK